MNIVLVHGAFADGSSWEKVILLLQARRYHVTAVQLPLTSLADDVATTRRAIARQDGQVILVGHSWGGVVITEAGVDPKVAELVYIAAFAPEPGETLTTLAKPYPTPPALTAPIRDAEGFVTLPVDAFVKHFASDLPASDTRVLAATQVPIHGSAFDAQVSVAAWATKPTWYVVSKLDATIPPDEERFFAKRMNAMTFEVNASHLAMLSQPKAVAGVIMNAVARALENASDTSELGASSVPAAANAPDTAELGASSAPAAANASHRADLRASSPPSAANAPQTAELRTSSPPAAANMPETAELRASSPPTALDVATQVQ
jgi:pimeloyl-ACP methyl ester carboxylesterase